MSGCERRPNPTPVLLLHCCLGVALLLRLLQNVSPTNLEEPEERKRLSDETRGFRVAPNTTPYIPLTASSQATPKSGVGQACSWTNPRDSVPQREKQNTVRFCPRNPGLKYRKEAGDEDLGLAKTNGQSFESGQEHLKNDLGTPVRAPEKRNPPTGTQKEQS